MHRRLLSERNTVHLMGPVYVSWGKLHHRYRLFILAWSRIVLAVTQSNCINKISPASFIINRVLIALFIFRHFTFSNHSLNINKLIPLTLLWRIQDIFMMTVLCSVFYLNIKYIKWMYHSIQLAGSYKRCQKPSLAGWFLLHVFNWHLNTGSKKMKS